MRHNADIDIQYRCEKVWIVFLPFPETVFPRTLRGKSPGNPQIPELKQSGRNAINSKDSSNSTWDTVRAAEAYVSLLRILHRSARFHPDREIPTSPLMMKMTSSAYLGKGK